MKRIGDRFCKLVNRFGPSILTILSCISVSSIDLISKPQFDQFFEELQNNPPDWMEAATSLRTGFVYTLVNDIMRTVDINSSGSDGSSPSDGDYSDAAAVKEEDMDVKPTPGDSEEYMDEPQLKRSRK